MKFLTALGLLTLAGASLASPLGKDIKDVTRKRQVTDSDILNYALNLEALEGELDVVRS